MSKWIDFTIDERKAMIQAVSEEKQIDEASAEKDWWVTAVLYAESLDFSALMKRMAELQERFRMISNEL